MKPELSIQIIYHDADMLELQVHASNAKFAGTVNVYAGNEKTLANFGQKLLGFPKGVNQRETIEFGATEEYMNGVREIQKTHSQILADTAYVRIEFICSDAWLSHPFVKIELHQSSEDTSIEEPIARAIFELKTEPAQIDDFAKALIAIDRNTSKIAILQGHY